MKTNSWSYSYSYTNDGNNENKEVHDEYFDGNNIYKRGFSVDKRLKVNNKTEKFYKYNKNENKEKKILGKSKNNRKFHKGR